MTGAFETGIYRNVFKECGYTEAEIEQRVEDTFRRIFMGQRRNAFIMKSGKIWRMWKIPEIMTCARKECPMA